MPRLENAWKSDRKVIIETPKDTTAISKCNLYSGGKKEIYAHLPKLSV